MAQAKTRWGFTAEEWESTREQMRAVLTDVAARRSTITYGDLAAVVAGGRVTARSGALMRMLGEVCESEDARRGVMFGSLVVRADSGMPGEGYFAFAGQLGCDVEQRRRFWEKEIGRVWDTFSPVAGE